MLSVVARDLSPSQGSSVSCRGTPPLQSNVLRRGLHPILAELGVQKAAFRTIRRSRATYLSNGNMACSGVATDDPAFCFWSEVMLKGFFEEHVPSLDSVRLD